MKKRIVVIENDERLRNLIVSLVDISKDFFAMNSYACCEEALKEIIGDAPDIIIMNLDFPVTKGIEVIPKFKRKLPAVEILVLSSHTDSYTVFEALSAGANGYVLIDSLNNLNLYLHDLGMGGSPLDVFIARKLVESLQVSNVSPISERETEVLKLMIQGNSCTQIGEALHIAATTAKTHVKNIYKKMKVNSKSEAVRKAIEHRMISHSLAGRFTPKNKFHQREAT